MIKSQHDEGFNLIYKSLKHFDFNISETPSKKIKPIPEDRFISYCLNLLQNYLKSKSDKYFVFWLLDNFSNISSDSYKINQDFQKFVFSWKFYIALNKQAELLLIFLNTTYGTNETISEFLRLRKQILKHNQIKSFDKITIDYQNILFIINKLYSTNIINLISDKIKQFYQKTKATFKYDTKVEAILICQIILQTIVLEKQQIQSLKKYINQSQSRNSIDTESLVYNYVIFDSVISDEQQNTFSFDSVSQSALTEKYIQNNTFSICTNNKTRKQQSFQKQTNQNQHQQEKKQHIVEKQLQKFRINSASRSWNSMNKKKLLINKMKK